MRFLFSLVSLFTVVVLICAVPQQKTKIIGKEIQSTNANGETDDVTLTNGKVAGNYKGKKGNGPYSADEKIVGNNIEGNGIGPGNKREFINIDKKKKHAVGTSDKGAKMNADSANDKEIVADAGGKTYNVHRPKPDTAIVQPKGGSKTYEADGLSPGMHDVRLKGGPLPIRSQYNSKDANGDGKPEAINTRETEELLPGVGNARDVNTVQGDGINTEGSITAKNSLRSSLTDDPLAPQSNSFLNPSMTVTEKKVEAQPCVQDAGGNDAMGDNGFKIVDNKITVQYKNSKDSKGTTYSFPDCITVKAKIQIPKGVDVKKVGFQGLVYLNPAGTMKCEEANECKKSAPGKPDGPCFFCDLCSGDKSHKMGSSVQAKYDLCEKAVAGQTAPLTWEVCPPSDPKKYDAFKKDFLKDSGKGDVDVVIEIFQLKPQTAEDRNKVCGQSKGLFGINTNANCNGPFQPGQEGWSLVGCRKSRLSYSVSAGSTNLGSPKDAFKGLPSFGGGGGNGLGKPPAFPGLPGLGK